MKLDASSYQEQNKGPQDMSAKPGERERRRCTSPPTHFYTNVAQLKITSFFGLLMT